MVRSPTIFASRFLELFTQGSFQSKMAFPRAYVNITIIGANDSPFTISQDFSTLWPGHKNKIINFKRGQRGRKIKVFVKTDNLFFTSNGSSVLNSELIKPKMDKIDKEERMTKIHKSL